MKVQQPIIFGIRWTTFSAVFLSIGGLLQLYILLRILSVTDFALMALANVVISMATQLIGETTGNAIIQRQEVSAKELSTLYWINIFMGLMLMCLSFILGPIMAVFFNAPSLSIMIPVVGLGILSMVLGLQYKYLLQKEFCFDTISKIEMVAFTFSFPSIILLALEGYGALALVWGFVIRVSLESVLYIYKGFKIHQPSWYFNLKEVGFYIRFGLYQGGERLMDSLTFQMDSLIIGKLLGLDQLGIYDVTKRLLLRPTGLLLSIAEKVTFPIMAKIQEQDQLLKQIHLNTISYLGFLQFSFYLFCLAFAIPLVQLFYGENFTDVSTIFGIFSLMIIFRMPRLSVEALVLAKGEVAKWLYWKMALFFLTLVALLIGTAYGLNGIVWSLTILQIILFYPCFFFLVKPFLPVSFWEYFWRFLEPLFISILALSPVFLIMGLFFPSLEASWKVIISGTGFLLCFFLLIKSWKPQLLLQLKDLLIIRNSGN